MSSSVERFDEKARREVGRHGQTVVHRGELLRHPVYTRLLHWSVAITFILSLTSGFAIYSPWLYRWLSPFFGGGPMTRFLHPWFGLLFDIFFLFQFLNWFMPMRWTKVDSRWLRRIKQYTTNREKLEAEEVGFFNGGQKLYFWAIVLSGLLFLISGIALWFDNAVPRWLVAVSYVVHDIAALIMLAGFIIHIYEGTAAQPGTFSSMTNGTVTKEWAWTHHPAWYKNLTGRDPREDYERASRRQRERAHAIETWEREQEQSEQAEQAGEPTELPEH
ncbi:MAG TPA: formate dehydrogenase subunit gamma [Pyrinomonadaceae bacterium]|jgi:formate dehydrogenase subunit gamma|nr:formate dehydrogenase subunit gamma [Pyrinomonadaceae bacterium]